jgi:outer membrane protein OmpA-like peptidoglycan-associated protein
MEKTPQPIDNEPVVIKKPIQETTPTVFNSSNDIDVKKLKIGDIFELGNIYFKADDYQLNSKSQETLLELATFLNANKSVKIEIGGHTNLLPTNEYAVKLSSDRAKSVMEFLKENGVNASNLSFKGYGKNKPKLTDKTVEANQKNQRVEVKILAK